MALYWQLFSISFSKWSQAWNQPFFFTVLAHWVGTHIKLPTTACRLHSALERNIVQAYKVKVLTIPECSSLTSCCKRIKVTNCSCLLTIGKLWNKTNTFSSLSLYYLQMDEVGAYYKRGGSYLGQVWLVLTGNNTVMLGTIFRLLETSGHSVKWFSEKVGL